LYVRKTTLSEQMGGPIRWFRASGRNTNLGLVAVLSHLQTPAGGPLGGLLGPTNQRKRKKVKISLTTLNLRIG
jgi:hypothetical protein